MRYCGLIDLAALVCWVSPTDTHTLYRLCLCLQSIRVILNDSYEDIRPDWIEWLISWFGLCVSYNHRCKIEIKKKTKSKYSQCNDDTQRLTICICTIIVTALTKRCRQMYNHHSIILGIFVSRTSKKRQRQIISNNIKDEQALGAIRCPILGIWPYELIKSTVIKPWINLHLSKKKIKGLMRGCLSGKNLLGVWASVCRRKVSQYFAVSCKT